MYYVNLQNGVSSFAKMVERILDWMYMLPEHLMVSNTLSIRVQCNAWGSKLFYHFEGAMHK